MWWGRQAGSLHQVSLAEGPGGLRAVTERILSAQAPPPTTGAHLLLSKAGHTSSFSPHHRAPHRAPGRPRWFAPSPYPGLTKTPLGSLTAQVPTEVVGVFCLTQGLAPRLTEGDRLCGAQSPPAGCSCWARLKQTYQDCSLVLE